MMRKNMKLLLIPCTAAALTLGSAMISFAATGWAEENGQWVYYNNDGSKATDVFKKSGNGWFYLDEDGYMAKSQIVEGGRQLLLCELCGRHGLQRVARG
ncbi:cell wall-binding repeat protein [[Clostridium] asparagiforme DSM 15981]|uniref:Cell wall-binding repeat protein n=1 Tax=[Clostridium] asparagiforme DSM 15981 TaxID=518636 RepID=C0CVV1_9FIRM|nr:hypothetical protein [Enterocloster asparagiformis]EEG56810.1 cell wall-binding repeat protein [[Clostridium] asparagiforme DSM 15981]